MDNEDFDMRGMMDYVDSAMNSDSLPDELAIFMDCALFLESQAHRWHLETFNYAQHMELNELYDGLPDLIDPVIEGVMEKFGPLAYETQMQFQFVPVDSAISYLEQFKDKCYNIHGMLEQMNMIGTINTFEDLISFIDSILMKLKYQK